MDNNNSYSHAGLWILICMRGDFCIYHFVSVVKEAEENMQHALKSFRIFLWLFLFVFLFFYLSA